MRTALQDYSVPKALASPRREGVRSAYRASLAHVLGARSQGDVRFGLTSADVAAILKPDTRAFVALEFPDVLEEVTRRVVDGVYFSADDLRSGVTAAQSVDGAAVQASPEEVAAAVAADGKVLTDVETVRRLAVIEARRRKGAWSLIYWWAADWAAHRRALAARRRST